LARQIGYNLGAENSHQCVWGPNGDKAVDCCGPHFSDGYEMCYWQGGCNAEPYLPENGGTVMSYCHITEIGINLAKGFGEWPGDRIR